MDEPLEIGTGFQDHTCAYVGPPSAYDAFIFVTNYPGDYLVVKDLVSSIPC